MYLIQKNDFLDQLKTNGTLDKELLFYTTLITSEKGSVTGLKRADRIRDIAYIQSHNVVIVVLEASGSLGVISK